MTSKGTCQVCGGPITAKRRRKNCSQACFDASTRSYTSTKYQNDPTYRRKQLARARAWTHLRKSGAHPPQPCEVCGDPNAQMHHHKGYDHPLDVRWYCRRHHIEVERERIAS